MNTGIVLFFVIMVLYGALSSRLSRWWITGPMVFVGAGYLLGPGGVGWLNIAPDVESIKQLTEITLAILLFADASTLDLWKVEEDVNLPLRLLTIGLFVDHRLGRWWP